MKRIIPPITVIAMLVQLLLTICVSADNTVIATINNSTRHVIISGNSTANSDNSVNVIYPGHESVTLSSLNIGDALVYTNIAHSNSSGNYSLNFLLPENAPFGTYYVRAAEGGNTAEGSFVYSEYIQRTIFEESFDNSHLWDVTNMGVNGGAMISKSSGICSSTIKGDSSAFWQDAEYNIKFSFSDDNTGWFQFIFRNNGVTAERLLIYKSRICRYLPGQSPSEISLLSCSLLEDTIYNLKITAIGTNVSVALQNEDKTTILASKSYTVDNNQCGKIGFSTYDRLISIHDFSVKSVSDTDLFFNQKPVAVPVDSSIALQTTDYTGNAISYESSDTAVATVSGKTITGVAPGTTYVTVSDGTNTDKCAVTVVQKPTAITLSKEVLTLNKGDSIGVNATIEPSGCNTSGIIWESSNQSVASVFGSAYTLRTIHAENEGTAVITTKFPDGSVSDSITVKVMPEKDKGTINASFNAAAVGNPIKNNSFGVCINCGDSDTNTYNLLNDLNVNIVRSFGVAADASYQSSTFGFANSLDIPNMVVLPFHNQTVEQIVAQVGQINSSLEENSTLYIEFGNELYAGNEGMTAEQYIDKCREAYTAVKAAYPNALIGVPLQSTLINSNTWNNVLLADQTCYDAVILHKYSDFNSSVDGRTQDDTMQYLYAYNNYHKKIIDKYVTLAPGKDVWISEYGTLILTLFRQDDQSERARMQFAKSVGVSLTNMEHAMDMLSDSDVDMSSYHFSNDAQGFGIIQDETKLSNYYVFKEVSELLRSSTHFYEITPVQCGNLPADKCDIKGVNCATDNIGAWGFGTASGQQYAVFSNRTENSAKIMLNGKQLKRVWSYGGNDDILGDFLTNSLSYDAAPSVIPQPKTYTDSFVDGILMDKYSIVVCEVQADAGNISVSCNAITDSGAWDFNSDGGFKLAFGQAISNVSNNNVFLYENGNNVVCSLTSVGDNTYMVTPQNGFLYEAAYTLEVIAGGVNKSFSFKTIKKPFYESFTRDFYDVFSSDLSGNWTFSGTTGWKLSDGRLYKSTTSSKTIALNERTYDDFVMCLDLEITDSFAYYSAGFRGGSIRISNTGYVYSYFNGNNDRLVGIISMPQNGLISVKIVAYGNNIFMYAKNTGDTYYSYVGKIGNISDAVAGISFSGSGNFYIDNFEIKNNKTLFADVTCSQNDISIEGLTCGDNEIQVTLSDSLTGNYTLIASIGNGQTIDDVSMGELTGTREYTFDFNLSDCSSKLLKLFLWESLDSLRPLENVFIVE